MNIKNYEIKVSENVIALFVCVAVGIYCPILFSLRIRNTQLLSYLSRCEFHLIS